MIIRRLHLVAMAEGAFCIFALSMFLGAYAGLPLRLQGIAVKGGATNPYNAAAMALVLVGTAAFAAPRWRKFVFVARHGGLVNIFLALAASSVLWSLDPMVSGRKTITLLETVAFAYYLAACHPVERIIRFMAVAIGLSLVASTAVAIAVPSVGIMSEAELAGSWSGVFPHKSALGGTAATGALFFGWLWRNEPGRRWLHTGMLLLCVALTVLSRSKTAQFTITMTAMIALALPLLRLPGLAKIWAIYVIVVTALACAAVLALYFRPIMEALGKDASLTGRVPTWLGLLEVAWQHPLGGYGYNGFFIGTNPEVEDVWRRAGWTMWDAHSTFIEMLLHLGIPGAVVTGCAMAEMVIRSFRTWAEGERRWASFAVVYGLTYVATSTVETVMYRAGDVQTVLFPLVYVLLRIDSARRFAAATAENRRGRPLDPQYGVG